MAPFRDRIVTKMAPPSAPSGKTLRLRGLPFTVRGAGKARSKRGRRETKGTVGEGPWSGWRRVARRSWPRAWRALLPGRRMEGSEVDVDAFRGDGTSLHDAERWRGRRKTGVRDVWETKRPPRTLAERCSRADESHHHLPRGTRNAVEQATEEDVVQFFEGFELEHVRICTNASGRVTGDAYVRFANAAEAQAALSKRHRQMMGKRYIELFTAHDVERGDVPTVPSPVGTPARAQGGVVRLRGLPYVAVDTDVRAFLSGLDVLPNGVYLTKHADGRPTGEAFVEFASEESVSAALGRNKERMGTRYIEVFRATKEDMRMAMQRGNGALNDKIVGNGAPMEGDGCWLKLRGLPYSAVEGDIEQFFKGFTLAPNGIHLTKKGDRPKGEAYVEMVSPEEAERARATLHKSMLGSRYIEIFRSNRGDGARGRTAAWPTAVQPGYPAPIQQPPIAYSAAAMSNGGGMPQVQMAAMQQQSIQYLPTQHAHALGMDPLAWQAGLGIADYGNGLQLQHSHTWANVGNTYASHLGTPMQNWAQQ